MRFWGEKSLSERIAEQLAAGDNGHYIVMTREFASELVHVIEAAELVVTAMHEREFEYMKHPGFAIGFDQRYERQLDEAIRKMMIFMGKPR